MKNANNETRNLEGLTMAAIVARDSNGVEIEFGSHQTVTAVWGLKRGMLYALEKEGLIKGVSLRRKGQRHGKKLWSMPSIATYLHNLMQQQTKENKSA